MTINTLIALHAAQNQLLAQYPQTESEQALNMLIHSAPLCERLERYRNMLHQKFVVFHVAETITSIENELKSSEALSKSLSHSREAYNQIFMQFAKNLGDAASAGITGNYPGMLSRSIGAAIDFFQTDDALRAELHHDLIKKIEAGSINKLHEFVDSDHAMDNYLNTLRETHFYFQAEIEKYYEAKQIDFNDFQRAIVASSAWKEEILSAMQKLRDYNFQRYAKNTQENEIIRSVSYRQLSIRMISEFLISPQKTGKINNVSELLHLKNKYLNARRDINICDAINTDVGVRTEELLQNCSLKIHSNSKKLKALVATLKRHVIANAYNTLVGNDETLIVYISKRLALALKSNLTKEECLTLFADYYFNQVDRQAFNDRTLEKRLIPGYGFFEQQTDKGRTLFETLGHLSHHPTLQTERIKIVLQYYATHFKQKLLASKHININDERKIEMFVLKYMNALLKQSDTSQFYQSYFAGIFQFKAVLPQPTQIQMITAASHPGRFAVQFIYPVLESPFTAMPATQERTARLFSR